MADEVQASPSGNQGTLDKKGSINDSTAESTPSIERPPQNPVQQTPVSKDKPGIYSIDATPPCSIRGGGMTYSYNVVDREDGQQEVTYTQDIRGMDKVSSTSILPDIRLEDLGTKIQTIEIGVKGGAIATIDAKVLKALCEKSGRKPLVEAYGYILDITEEIDGKFERRLESGNNQLNDELNIPPRSFEEYIKNPQQFKVPKPRAINPETGLPYYEASTAPERNAHFDALLAQGPKAAQASQVVNMNNLQVPPVPNERSVEKVSLS